MAPESSQLSKYYPVLIFRDIPWLAIKDNCYNNNCYLSNAWYALINCIVYTLSNLPDGNQTDRFVHQLSF